MYMSYARAAAMRGRNPANPSERAKSNGLYRQRIELGGGYKQYRYYRSEG